MLQKDSIPYEFYIKHILSTNWILAKYISDNKEHIELLINNTSDITFEKDDKVLYLIKQGNKEHIFNTVISNVDFPTYDKITLLIRKPFERSRYFK